MNDPARPGLVVLDERIAGVFAGAGPLERLATGARWSEGPVWIAERDCVLWSDIPNDRILRWSRANGLDVWADGVEFTNGHARDRDGSVLHCSHGLRALYRTSIDGGPPEVIVDRYRGRRFNSPNDVVVKRDGTVWFTDPPLWPARARRGARRRVRDRRLPRVPLRSGHG